MTEAAAPWILIDERRRAIADVIERAARATTGFEASGVKPGDVVAVYMRNDFPMIEATLGAGMAGAYVVPVNWHNTVEEARYVLSDCGAKVLVVHADLYRTIGAAIPDGVTVIVAAPSAALRAGFHISDADAAVPAGVAEWEGWLDSFAPKQPPYEVSPGSMIYTSGTTGHPKGVRRNPPTPEEVTSGRDQVRYLADLMDYGDRMHEITLLIPGPAYHSSPNGWLFSFINQGANVVVEPRFDARHLLEVVERERVTHVLGVPTMFVRLLALPDDVKARYDVSSIRQVMHVGAPCPPHVKRDLIAWWGPVITEHYGSTEVGAVTHCTAQEWLDHPGTVGRVMPNATVVIMDDEGNRLPPGQSGEIVCGRTLFPDFTYHGDDAKRQRSSRGNLVATGDVGYFDDEGYLYLSGRASDMIIFGGTNIYPAEIEAELHRTPGVADCAVFGIPDADYGEIVCAYLQPYPGVTLEAEEVRADLRTRLASYKIPRRIEIAETLPREDTGKIFKRKLRDPYWSGTGRSI
ncbi:MAG: acyl-CoA synthetase [Rhodoblastus sp.]